MRASVALLLLGRASDDLDAHVPAHVEAARRVSAIPLAITSATEAAAIRAPDLVIEHLPALSDVLEATEEQPDIAALYLLRRLELMFDKWLVIECRWSGQEAEDLVALRASRPELARSRVRFVRLG